MFSGAFVDAEGEAGDFFERIGSEFEFYAFGFQQACTAASATNFGSVRMRTKSSMVSDWQFDADGKPALQFGDEVARLRDVECARGDEQDVVGADHAVARVDGGAFDDRKDVALYAFRAKRRGRAAFAAGDFVDFIQEDDAGVFHAVDGGARDLLHVDEALFFFLKLNTRRPR